MKKNYDLVLDIVVNNKIFISLNLVNKFKLIAKTLYSFRR